MTTSRNLRRLLCLLLSVAMVLSMMVSGVFAETNTEPSKQNAQELELTELDPSSLNVKKLGELSHTDIQ